MYWGHESGDCRGISFNLFIYAIHVVREKWGLIPSLGSGYLSQLLPVTVTTHPNKSSFRKEGLFGSQFKACTISVWKSKNRSLKQLLTPHLQSGSRER